MAAAVFPHHLSVVGEKGEERTVVAEEFVVGAEGEMYLAVGGMELLEHFAVEVFVLPQAFLSVGRRRAARQAADDADNIVHGVDAPHRTLEEAGAAEGVVAAHAAAEENVGFLGGDDFLECAEEFGGRDVVVVEGGGDDVCFGEHFPKELCFHGLSCGTVAVDVEEGCHGIGGNAIVCLLLCLTLVE